VTPKGTAVPTEIESKLKLANKYYFSIGNNFIRRAKNLKKDILI
jgi:hypothetical protein